jgi:SAM-dependent methyltransferase
VEESLRRRARQARADIVAGTLRGDALVRAIEDVAALDRDTWIDEVLGIESLVPDMPGLPRGAVPYLPCGVDDVVALLREAPVGPDDDFVDLGSGLGRVVLLARLLTGARASGIELQDHLVDAARAATAALGLDRGANPVSFQHADASVAELDGSVFFLYAPFNGAMLDRVIDRLEAVGRRRRITVCTVGVELAVPWLVARTSGYVARTIYDLRQ